MCADEVLDGEIGRVLESLLESYIANDLTRVRSLVPYSLECGLECEDERGRDKP